MELSTDRARSPTHSLVVKNAPGSDNSAFLTTSFDDIDSKGLTCSFDLFIDSMGPKSNSLATMLRFMVKTNAQSEAPHLLVKFNPASGSDQTSFLVNEGAADGYAFSRNLPVKKWLQVVVGLDLRARTVELKLDRSLELTAPIPIAITKHDGIQMSLGVIESSVEFQYFVDDIVCDIL